MQQFELGNTGIQVSAMALGCLNFGSRNDRGTSYRLLDQYVDTGGTFLDTANNYAFWNEGCVGGESESLLGQWMRERGNRDRMLIATKVGAMPLSPGAGFDAIEGLSQRAIEHAIDQSLKRLGTDYVDLYYAHIDDTSTPLEETLEALDKLVQAGKVRAIGCSNYPLPRLQEALRISEAGNLTPYSCIQQRYTYLRPAPDADFGIQVSADEELLGYAGSRSDLTLLAYSPLLNGAYSSVEVALPESYSGPESQFRLRILTEIAAETGTTVNQIVLSWMLQNTPAVIPLIAASTKEQLSENLGALEVRLSRDQIERLNQA